MEEESVDHEPNSVVNGATDAGEKPAAANDEEMEEPAAVNDEDPAANKEEEPAANKEEEPAAAAVEAETNGKRERTPDGEAEDDAEPPAKKEKRAEEESGSGDANGAAEAEASDQAQAETTEPAEAVPEVFVDRDRRLLSKKPSNSSSKLTELEKYWKPIKDDPSDFTGWTYLLQYVDQGVRLSYSYLQSC
jgi:pre-mRNA-processing factor 39